MHKIFYFSGTGNTLAAAKRIASQLNGDVELISIAALSRGAEVDFSDADTVGIFHPVYCFGVPGIVQAFVERIKKLNKGTKHPYLYSLCTSSGLLGSAHLIMEQILKKRGYKLNAYFHIPMASNYIARAKAPNPRRLVKMLERANKRLDAAAAKIAANKNRRPIHVFPLDIFGEIAGKRAVSYMYDYDKYFWLNENCTNCGLCEKICPASNIIIMNGMPTWRGHCEQCMACLQWCPQEAIQFRQISLKRARYHHPEIKPEDLFRSVSSTVIKKENDETN